MSDIVEEMDRLSRYPTEWWFDPEECARARDEIARLRTEVERLVKSRNRWGQKYNKLLGKNKNTRAELATQVQWVKDLADSLIAEEAKTSTLRAEVERIRAALKMKNDAEQECLNAVEYVGRYNSGDRCNEAKGRVMAAFTTLEIALGDTHE